LKICSISFIGPIPIDLTRLILLEKIGFGRDPLLTGFIERRVGFIFIFPFEKLGEFPLVEGSFRNLIEANLSHGISSLDDKNFHVLEFILFVVVLDRSWNFKRFC